MANKKIKKSATTLGGIVFSILIAIGIFSGMFLWMQSNSKDSIGFNDPIYNESYTRLQTEQGYLDSSFEEMKDGARLLTEADASFGSAWNGLIGLLSVFKIPFNLLSIGETVLDVTTAPLAGVVPGWVIGLMGVGLLAFIVLVIVSILKGDNNVIR